ncbi:MAG TPA: imidazole glycerol phosphate synthase subunit HisF [Gammaproteobacteria bacterium]|nr:imidazole glycerol phosphate synthase subunit HisF [Gammaproteobacteria bacterium]
MLAKRIIPCLDVKEGKVVKGVQFKNHKIMGDILERAMYYSQSGADELVFYDITASCEGRSVDREWIKEVAKNISIPFCVAGGIKSIKEAESILHSGADKISINSPALENPNLINQLVKIFGTQCIVIGIDSLKIENNYRVCQYTGDEHKSKNTQRLTIDWIKEIQDRGAGEIVLNSMNQDGMRKGYDIEQLKSIREKISIPLIASGGAGDMQDFEKVFVETGVSGALAASVFHSNTINILDLKKFLRTQNIEVRV